MATAVPLMSVQLKGALETQKNLKRIAGEFDQAVEESVGLSGEAVKAQAQSNLSGPILKVKTGHLRGSVGTKLEKDGMDSSVIVGTSVGYGDVHEHGGPRNKAVMWLAKSLEQSSQTVRDIFNRLIKRVK